MRERVDGIAIVGAGVAGLTLAAALRARGLPAVLTGTRIGGSVVDGGPGDGAGQSRFDRGLHLWPGALGALEHIGAGAETRARGTPVERLRLWSSTGRLLLEVGPREGSGVLGGVAIRSSALVGLLAATCTGVPIDAGRRAIGYSEDDHGVALTFDGGWPLRAPVVVGADGIRSVIRAHCLDDGPPSYSGDSVWEGIGPLADRLPPRTLDVFWGPRGLRAGAMRLEGPDGGSAWWADLDTGVGGALQPGPRKPELAVVLSELRGPLPDIVAATPEAAIRRTDVFARRRARAEGDGRVTLIGDASHALPITLRVGASLAIEDAVALADALLAEANPVQALRLYERGRHARVAHADRVLWRLRAFEVRHSAAASRARDRWMEHMSAPTVASLLHGLVSGTAPAGAISTQSHA